ncbi:hypothetical protein EMCRGX_G019540 [Ephydatia muelleri]
MPTYPYQLLKPGNDSVCTTASGDNFFDVCVSVILAKVDCTVSYCILLLECKSTCHTQRHWCLTFYLWHPHPLVMLPPMMNMEFYDIDIVMAMQLPHYRLHKTTYKSTQTRWQWNVFLGFAGYMQSEKATTRDTELALEFC